MTSKWETTRLGDLLAPVRRTFSAVASEEYMLVTLPLYGKGARLRKTVLGSELGTAKYRVHAGDLMISKIDARKGSNSLLPPELNDAVVTGDFLSYEVNIGIAEIEFMDLVAKSVWFADLCDSVSSGTTNRVRLDVNRFLDLTISLPPLAEQRRIVDLIGALDEAIEAANQKANDTADLLLSLQSAAPDGLMVPLGAVLTDIDSGVSSKPSEDADGTLDIGILKVSAVRSALFQADEIKRLGNLQLPEKARVREGDLLITRSNTPTTVGQVCIAREVPADSFLPDLIWRLNFDRALVVPEFLEHYLSNSESRSAITSMATGTSLSMRKINKTNIKTLPISLPSLEAQVDYAERCDASRIELAFSRENVASLRILRSEMLTSLLSGAHTIPESYDELLEAVDA